jgi:hypothetical protein
MAFRWKEYSKTATPARQQGEWLLPGSQWGPDLTNLGHTRSVTTALLTYVHTLFKMRGSQIHAGWAEAVVVVKLRHDKIYHMVETENSLEELFEWTERSNPRKLEQISWLHMDDREAVSRLGPDHAAEVREALQRYLSETAARR